MFARIAIFCCDVSPGLRRLLWRWWYDRLATKFPSGDWTFMNYGFAPADGIGPELTAADEPDRFCIQLYQRVVSPAELAGVRVLEVGSGRGGGASYLARYHRPAAVAGLDFSARAIALSRGRHAAVENLTFGVGDAMNLPFSDASFDAVVNIESSHCYADVERFFNEAARVLRPGGHFLFADARAAAAMPELEARLAAEPAWEYVAREDITAGVVAALAADDERKRRMMDEHVPPRMRRLLGEFAALAGTPMFERFRKRELLYHRHACRKRCRRSVPGWSDLPPSR